MFIVSGSLFLKTDLSFNYVCMRGFCVRVSACELRCPMRSEEVLGHLQLSYECLWAVWVGCWSMDSGLLRWWAFSPAPASGNILNSMHHSQLSLHHLHSCVFYLAISVAPSRNEDVTDHGRQTHCHLTGCACYCKPLPINWTYCALLSFIGNQVFNIKLKFFWLLWNFQGSPQDKCHRDDKGYAMLTLVIKWFS